MAEAQADVTIRGGIFENTGFRVASATLLDPQSGHYFAEIPIAPQMLTGPAILTGADNALYGMNSSVGTVSFGWKPIITGGSVSLGTGTNDFNLQSIHGAKSTKLDSLNSLNNYTLGFEGEYSHSQSDGTIDFGDHDFTRTAGRVQLSRLTISNRFIFWLLKISFLVGQIYTPHLALTKQKSLETRLLMLNHKQNYAQDSNFEVSAYYRTAQRSLYLLSRKSQCI